MGRGEGGDHAGGAASHHDDVVLLNSHVEHVIELPGLQDNCAGRRNEGTSHQCSLMRCVTSWLPTSPRPSAAASRSAPLTDGNPDIDVVDAYEIQLINIRQRVAEGARVIGHKVGLSSRGHAEDDERGRTRLRAPARRDAGLRGPPGPVRRSTCTRASRSRSGSSWPTTCPAQAAPRTTCWRRPPRSPRRSS